MHIEQDDSFRDERGRFALRFTCEHCALFDPGRGRCVHGYPTDEHRTRRYGRRDAAIVFCKDFDLL